MSRPQTELRGCPATVPIMNSPRAAKLYNRADLGKVKGWSSPLDATAQFENWVMISNWDQVYKNFPAYCCSIVSMDQLYIYIENSAQTNHKLWFSSSVYQYEVYRFYLVSGVFPLFNMFCFECIVWSLLRLCHPRRPAWFAGNELRCDRIFVVSCDNGVRNKCTVKTIRVIVQIDALRKIKRKGQLNKIIMKQKGLNSCHLDFSYLVV